jgi:hypothetical protein
MNKEDDMSRSRYGSASNSTEGYRFDIVDGTVTAVYKEKRGALRLERMDSNEVWTFDGTNVTKTERDDGRLEITVFSDDNNDGLFVKSSKTYAPDTTPDTTPDATPDSTPDTTPDASPDVIGETHDDSIDGSHDDDGDDETGEDHGINTGGNTVMMDGYQIEIVNGQVVSVVEVDDNEIEAVRIGSNEVWTVNGSDVTKVETNYRDVETEVLRETDQPDTYVKVLEVDVSSSVSARDAETYKFVLADTSFAEGDLMTGTEDVTAALELGRRGWREDRLDSNEDFDVALVGDDIYIVKTETQRNGDLEFKLFRDDDGDGLWTEIAEGEAGQAFQTFAGGLDLNSIYDAGILDTAAGIIA